MRGRGGQSDGLNKTGLGNRNYDEGETSGEVFQEDLCVGRDTGRYRK